MFLGQRWGVMSSVRQYHTIAMEFAQKALVARHAGDSTRAVDMARQAYEHELQAAQLVPNAESSQPTRAILYRSAASLAYQCHELKRAQALVFEGLQYAPPERVREELLTLLRQIEFALYLQEHQMVLEDEEINTQG